MAKIQEQLIAIKVSKLTKDDKKETDELVSKDIAAQVELVVQELLPDMVVEVITE